MAARSIFTKPLWQTSMAFAVLTTTLQLSGCGGTGAATAMISGSVSGLTQGTSVDLENNGSEAITVAANGNFHFNGQVQAGTPYAVTVDVYPIGSICQVKNGSGIVGQYSEDVTNIEVICAAGQGNVFGNVSGLATGTTVSLKNTDLLSTKSVTNELTIGTDGPFVFPTEIPLGFSYDVVVTAQPAGQTCTISDGTGTMPAKGSITSIQVTCQ